MCFTLYFKLRLLINLIYRNMVTYLHATPTKAVLTVEVLLNNVYYVA